jgi:hypothetical protein
MMLAGPEPDLSPVYLRSYLGQSRGDKGDSTLASFLALWNNILDGGDFSLQRASRRVMLHILRSGATGHYLIPALLRPD